MSPPSCQCASPASLWDFMLEIATEVIVLEGQVGGKLILEIEICTLMFDIYFV